MSAEIKSHLTELLTSALASVAPQQAKPLRRSAREIAQELVAAIPASDWLAGTEVAGPGFINLRLHPAAKQFTVRTILAQGGQYGRSRRGQSQPVIVEFVSANPTGPLHVGHGRQAALGDAISALLESQGYRVTREFYYNDAGAQIENLALSVQARIREMLREPVEFPADGYHGEYIREIAEKYVAGGARDGEDLRAFGVAFDNYYLESSLYNDGRVEEAVAALASAGKTYEQDGALWLRTTEYGDDKDRVMRKSDGTYTYFVPDVAYHITKWERGFRRAINIQGSDHHSTLTRVRAGLQALSATLCRGITKGYPEYVLHKMVTVMKGGDEVKLSKRAGTYVTLRDLIDEVGRDATRFFLVSRRADTEFAFDVDLAKSQSEENPVYYVQYAHARICRLMEQWRAQYPGEREAARAPLEDCLKDIDLSPLAGTRELALLAKLGAYPEMLEGAAKELAPHQVAFYLRELAGEFHSYYNAERILVPETPVRLARLALAAAVRQALRNGLALIGVSAPETM